MGEAKVDRGDAVQLIIQRYPREYSLRVVLLPLSTAANLKHKGRQDGHQIHRPKDPTVKLHPQQQQEQHAIAATRVADLPAQVFERLLLLLPIQSLFQARAVCQAWKSIISSSSFLPLWLETFHDRCFLMGYPDGRQIMCISDVGLKQKWQCYKPPSPPFLSLHNNEDVLAIHPAASDGGLVLYYCQDSQKQTTTLCVFNPFTGSYRMLPPVDLVTYGVGRTQVLISVDPSGAGYLVFVVGLTRRPNKDKAGIVLSVYDSRTRNWVKRGITPEDSSIAPGNWSAVHSNGVLYILSHVDGVISYDHEQDIWGRVGTPLREIYVNGWLVQEKLLLHEGRLLLIGTTLERDEYTDELLHRLYIYELRSQPGYGNSHSPYVHWELFDKMPDAVMHDINPHSRAFILPPDELLEDIDPQSFAKHNILPVSCYQCEDVVLLFFPGQSSYNYVQSPALVAYRLSTKVWTRILRWNDVPVQKFGTQKNDVPVQKFGIEKIRAVSGGQHSRLMFNVVGFKPSLATI